MANKKSSKSGGKNIAGAMWELVEPTVNRLGFTLWDVEFVKEGSSYYLRFTIDSVNGVDIDGCEKVHRAIDPLIDEADPIDEFYYLEVSSPGLERSLRSDTHFRWAIEREEVVLLKLFHPIDGVKDWRGILTDIEEDGGLVLQTDDGRKQIIPRDAVSKASVFYDFDAEDSSFGEEEDNSKE